MKKEKRRRPTSNGKKVNMICLSVIAALYTLITVLNLAQTERPTISENENRELATMPRFSFAALFDGSYFRGLSEFVSDTFWDRDNLVDASKKLDMLRGFSGKVVMALDPKADEPDGNDDDINRKLETLFDLPATTVPFTETEPATVYVEPTDPTVWFPKFSFDKVSIMDGSSQTITFSIEEKGIEGGEMPEPVWEKPDGKIASITIDGDKITILGINVGLAELKLTVGDNSAAVSIEVYAPEIREPDDPGAGDEIDIMNKGVFIYNGRGYTKGGITKKRAENYAKTIEYYAALFPEVRVTALVGPTSSVTITDPEVRSQLSNDQVADLDMLASLFTGRAGFVNIGHTIFEHRDEYIYFKNDHHWTQLGAYYAYVDLIRYLGEEPVMLEDMIYHKITDKFQGSYFRYTQNQFFKKIYDTLDTWRPDVELTMTVKKNGKTTKYDTCILNQKRYFCFIGGDAAYTVINVPENPQDKSVLIIKDSYADALTPFLTAHYGNIFVVDPRYVSINLLNKFGDYGLTDILFINNITCANQAKWANYYLGMVGK